MYVTYTQLLTGLLPILAKDTTANTSEQRAVAIRGPPHQIPQRTRQGIVEYSVSLPNCLLGVTCMVIHIDVKLPSELFSKLVNCPDYCTDTKYFVLPRVEEKQDRGGRDRFKSS